MAVIWEYVIDDVYDDYSTIPASLAPGHRMTLEQLEKHVKLRGKVVAGVAIKPGESLAWNLQRHLGARGKEGWDLITIMLFPSSRNDVEPTYWKLFFKRPVPVAAPHQPR